MNVHTAEAIIVTCIDFRLQEFINRWIAQNLETGTFDRVAFAGGVKDLENILKQVKIANDLHHIKKVVLVNHEDCGAYGDAGTRAKHVEDLTGAFNMVKKLYPALEVETYYLKLSGEFEKVS